MVGCGCKDGDSFRGTDGLMEFPTRPVTDSTVAELVPEQLGVRQSSHRVRTGRILSFLTVTTVCNQIVELVHPLLL